MKKAHESDHLPASAWWGEYAVTGRQNLDCHIGPLQLVIHNRDGEEWQIAYERGEEADTQTSVCTMTTSDMDLTQYSHHSRYVLRDESGRLYLKPRLADRPIVSRPWSPFHLTAGEEVTLYLSSPMWLEIAVGKRERVLEEIAIHRPSDTWFGPSTREGELCYASRTQCRLRLDELPWRPHRAITPVLIRNRADTLLNLERLSIPVTFLSLYAAPDASLWTPRVTLTREQDGDMAALKIDNQAPAEIGAATLVDRPRQTGGASTLVRAFNALFT